MCFGCTNEEAWSSSDYFIGSWEFETSTFSCCEECFDNYEEDCILIDGPAQGEIVFLKNGGCYRQWETSGDKDTLVWCYNSNTQVLVLKNEDGAFSNFENKYTIQEFKGESFSAELMLPTTLLWVNSFKRK